MKSRRLKKGPQHFDLVDCPGCPGNVKVKVPKADPNGRVRIKVGPNSYVLMTREEANKPCSQFAAAAASVSETTKPQNLSGRGIVTCAGGSVYFTCVWLLVNVLRRLGCTLPIQVWHIGREEMDYRMQSLLESVPGVRVINGKDHQGPKRWGGWELKVHAIRNSGFKEVLFLDADQVPIADPTHLFDNSQYQETGCVFWPDLLPYGWTMTERAFTKAGLPVPGNSKGYKNPTDYTPLETGQMLIDVERCWPELELTQWLCDRSPDWFPLMYGDKDLFYIAWNKLERKYTLPTNPKWLGVRGQETKGWAVGAFVHHDLDGKPLFQHRVQPFGIKWRLYGHNEPCPGFIHEDWCNELLARLRDKWSGEVWSHHEWTPQDLEFGVGLYGTSWQLSFDDNETGINVKLLADGSVDGARNPNYGRWTVLHTVHGMPLLALCGPAKATVFLGQDSGGCWRNHGEKVMMVRLVPDGWRYTDPMSLVMFNEVVVNNEYRLPDRFPADAVIMDVGAHQGSFARACLDRGAIPGNVHCIECNPDNFKLLQQNVPGVKHYPLAAWTEFSKLRLNFPEGARHSGGGCVVDQKEGVEVQAVPFDFLARKITESHKRIRLLKLDIEGAEFPILQCSQLLHLVDEIVGEYHLAHLRDRYNEDWLTERLFELGFGEVEVKQNHKDLGHFFARRMKS